jgi:hypothetical protein
MTTLVRANGAWNATPTFVGKGTWPVAASAPDPAGNVGSATQILTIASEAPAGQVAPSAPPTPGGGSSDVVAKTTVAGDANQKVKGAALSIGTKVTAPAGGRVVATASGTVRIQGVRKAIKLTSATVRIAAGHSLTLKLKPKGSSKVAKAAVKLIKDAVEKGKRVTATITVKIVGASGHTRHVTRTVKLTK